MDKKRTRYDSDITKEQFEKVRPILEGLRKHTRPRTVDLYDVFCAILYLTKTGCQWRNLPHDFPKWRTVHAYFQIWTQQDKKDKHKLDSVLQTLLKKKRW